MPLSDDISRLKKLQARQDKQDLRTEIGDLRGRIGRLRQKLANKLPDFENGRRIDARTASDLEELECLENNLKSLVLEEGKERSVAIAFWGCMSPFILLAAFCWFLLLTNPAS